MTDSLEIGYRTAIWKAPYIPCFRIAPEQRLFRGECVRDGYIRPHGLPHLWSSEVVVPGRPAWVEVQFAQEAEIGSVEIVFNSDLNALRHDLSGMRPVVRDYAVLALTEEGEREVVREEGNMLRFRRHAFAPVRARGVRLEVYAAWDYPYAEVFDLRVYGAGRGQSVQP